MSPSRRLGESFDRVPAEYERGRPGWPERAVELAARELGLGEGATVLDLAAGTGKLTRVLVRRFARVLAVEPLDGMRAVLQEVVAAAEAFAGSAEALPLPNASVDAVFCAEAFHWFDGERSLPEIARVLRPPGGLILMWNEPAGPFEPPLPAAAAARLRELRNTRKAPAERHDTGLWRAAFASSPFETLRERAVEHEHVLDREGVVAQFASQSYVASLSDADRERELELLRAALAGDRYRRTYRAELHWTRLRP